VFIEAIEIIDRGYARQLIFETAKGIIVFEVDNKGALECKTQGYNPLTVWMIRSKKWDVAGDPKAEVLKVNEPKEDNLFRRIKKKVLEQ